MADQDAPAATPKRYSREAIADRRRTVFEMVLMKGMSESAFAEQSGVSRNTIVEDVRCLRASMRTQVKELDVQSEIGDAKARFEKMAELALVEASFTKSPGSKAMLMGQALRAMELKTRLLLDTGYLPNAEKKVSGSLTLSGGLDMKQMSTGELKAMRDRLAGRIGALLGNQSNQN